MGRDRAARPVMLRGVRRSFVGAWLFTVAVACGGPPTARDAGSPRSDAGGSDAGLPGAGVDAGPSDAGLPDAGRADAGTTAGECSRRCVVDADCCPANTPGCPGAFPNNYRCVDEGGVRSCRGPACASTADCRSTLPAGYECLAIGAGATCVVPCTTDSQCSPSPVVCVGVSNDGGRFCNRVLTPFRCVVGDGQCAGAGECAPSGDRCVCTHDDDCADTRYRKDCVLR